MNSNNKPVWALWAIAASAVFVNFTYAFGLLSAGIEPDMNNLRFLAFSSEVANRSLANFDLIGIGYAAFTTVSNQFLHGNMFHLVTNVASLILLGYPIEKRFGAKTLGLWFFVGGAVGTLAQWYVADPKLPLLIFGASGGIMTITGMYQMLYATRTIQRNYWTLSLFAFSHVLLIPNFLALFGLMPDVITSTAKVGVVVHLVSAAFGWGLGFYLSRMSQESGEEIASANWKQCAVHTLLAVAITSGVAFAVGKSAPSLDDRFFKYEAPDLVYKLKRDLKFSTEALDKALQLPEVQAEFQNVIAGMKEMDNQAQLYVYLKNSSAVGGVEEADVVRHFIDALKASNMAASKAIKLVAREHDAFEQNLDQIRKAIGGGLKMNTVDLDLVVAPVMQKLAPVNQARSLLQSVQEAALVVLTPVVKERKVTRQMEMEAIFQVVTNYLDGIAKQNRQ